MTLDDFKANKAMVSMVVLLLTVVLTFASRESTHRTEKEQALNREAALEEANAVLRAEVTESEARLKSEVDKWRKRTLVVRTDGSREESEEETSRAVYEAEQRLKEEHLEQLNTMRSESERLVLRVHELEQAASKPGPRWLVLGEYAPTLGEWSLGAGVNIGPVSVFGLNPVAPTVAPRAGLGLRF